MSAAQMPNRLSSETSPYLLQHADNPVDWYPWGEEAFEEARRRDVPIMLSVGYSSCHWCHVMERESFENPATAALMNERFVNVKVDREERPDVDSVYMTAVQALTGHGGWPMTVFMTADGEPFYGGTYFPPDDRGGLPAFPRVLEAISNAFTARRSDVMSTSRQLVERIGQTFAAERGVDPLTDGVARSAFHTLSSQFDGASGGFGIQPKFPQPATLEFLLRCHVRTGAPQPLEMVELTLDRMAAGGIHDQIGGGFHRYSTDAFWLVPHFEKMLYDNALLASLYTRAWQVTGNAQYGAVAQGVVDYVLREMTSPYGGFYSAQDADSEGVEGKFFVWRPEQLAAILGRDTASIVADYYGVTREGNFEGMSILNVPRPAAQVAARHSMEESDLTSLVESANAKLLEARSERVPPMTDTKIITAWNGLMLAAVAEAAAAFDRSDYLEAARANAAFLLSRMTRDGRLRRTDSASENGAMGFLDDHSALVSGLLALHRADGGPCLAAGSRKACSADDRPVLGPAARAALRHGERSGEPDSPPARRDGQRPALRPLDDGGRADSPLRDHWRPRSALDSRKRAQGRARNHGAVPHRRRSLALRPRLVSLGVERGRHSDRVAVFGRQADAAPHRLGLPRRGGRRCRA